MPSPFRRASDKPDLALGQRDRKESEIRGSMEPCLLPVGQRTIGRSQKRGSLRRNQAHDDVRAVAVVIFRGKHHRGASLRYLGAGKCAHDDVPRLQ